MHGQLTIDKDEREFIGWITGLARAAGVVKKSLVSVRKAGAVATKGDGGPPKADKQDKGDKPKKATPKLSSHEIKEMGLKWVTATPKGASKGVPILVKDLGDELMVVGGAGGSMNFTRFKKRSKDEQEAHDKKKAEEKAKRDKKQAKPEVEVTPEMEEKASEAAVARKEATKSYTDTVMAALPEGFGDITKEEQDKITETAIKEAAKLGVSDEGTKEFVADFMKKHEKQKKVIIKRTAEQMAQDAVDAQVREDLTGSPQETPGTEMAQTEQEKAAGLKPRKLPGLTSEQHLAITRAAATKSEAASVYNSAMRALKTGDEATIKAIELSYAPLTDAQVKEYGLEQYVARAELETNVALVEATAEPGKMMSTAILEGAADTGAGMANDLTGATILSKEIAKELGTVGSARVIAQYLKEKSGDAGKAAEAVRAHIGTKSAATAAGAIQAANELGDDADQMAAFGKGADRLTSASSAAGSRLTYSNKAIRILGRALGSLETAAQVAWQLEGGAVGDLTVPGRATEAATRQKAKDLGLENGTFSVRKSDEGWALNIKEAGLAQMYNEQTISTYEENAEFADLRRKAYGVGDAEPEGWPDWSAKGQSDKYILGSHQKGSIKFFEKQKRVLIADEAGSGKTAMSLAAITDLHEQGKVKKALVVVPKSVADQFGKEVKFALDDKYHDQYQVATSDKMNSKKRQAAFAGDKLITVVTHDQLRNDHEAIMAAGYDAMVVDEAHELSIRGQSKDADKQGSERSKLARQIDTEYLMLMTGTVVKNDMTEFHSLIDWAQPDSLGSKKEFMDRFGKLDSQEGLMDGALLSQLKQQTMGAMMGVKLSTEKTDENGEKYMEMRPIIEGNPLVRMTEKTRFVDVSPEQRAAYRAKEEAFAAAKGTAAPMNAFARDHSHNATVNNINVEDHPKILAMKDDLARHPGEKAVIFAENTHSWDTIIEGLGLKKGEYRLLYGDTSGPARLKMAEEVNDPNSPVKYLVASDAANFGLNLHGATTLMNYDTTKTHAVHMQRIAREFRQRQKKEVHVYNYRSNTPYELKAQQRLKGKKGSSNLVDALNAVDETGMAGMFAEAFGTHEADPAP